MDILFKGRSHWNFLDLLESLYSFKISQKLTIKTRKNAVKAVDVFKNLCDEDRQYFVFFLMKQGYKVSYVKVLIFC